MNLTRSSGILLHPTSFPSKYGIGDLGKSAYDFIDFLKSAHQTLWQILPLGPTSFGDSPYQSFSTFAGNSLLISPDILIEKKYISENDIEYCNDISDEKVNYGEVISYKTKIFKKAFEGFKENNDPKIKEKFEIFCKENKLWLNDYCLYVAIKDYYIDKRKNDWHTPEYEDFYKKAKKITDGQIEDSLINDYYYGAVWSTWQEDLREHSPKAIKEWNKLLKEQVEYYKFLQFEFFEQWKALKVYANENDIKIIGDIPIFVAFDSSDVWANKELFYIEEGFPTSVAGVPPDYFSPTGQLWGNPLYIWEKHSKTNYKWWIERIKNTLSLVDIVRIDHFRGFESCWTVKFGEKTAENGFWNKSKGDELFTKIKKNFGEIPIIAEDLGIITDEVRELRDKFDFPGMKILQFAFDNSENNDYLPHNFDKNCIVYTGTHDNDTTLGWYLSTSEEVRDKFRRYMNVSGENPSHNLIRLAMSSPANFAIFPLQDVMCLDSSCRMNIPSVSSGNWQWRYKEGDLKIEYAEQLSYLSKLFSRNLKEKKEKDDIQDEK